MTLEELKTEAAKLSIDDRSALAEWINESADVREFRRATLVREIEVGLGQLRRGAAIECNGDAELRSFFDGVKARGRELLTTRADPR